jgi:hypothetical protein
MPGCASFPLLLLRSSLWNQGLNCLPDPYCSAKLDYLLLAALLMFASSVAMQNPPSTKEARLTGLPSS